MKKKKTDQAPQVNLSKQKKIEIIEDCFAKILTTLGLDLTDHSIAKTPNRVAKMYVNELFSGLDEKTFPKMTTTKDDFYQKRQGMILVRNIKVHSTCEHHLVPIIGVAHIAYLSNGSVLGLSKINRVVDFFSRRPQLQERMTTQIGEFLADTLKTRDVAVLVKAQHFCVMTRGIQDINSETITHYFLGRFKSDPELHKEFLENAIHSD